MKMVHGNAVFIREEVKLATNTHFQLETSLVSTPFNYTADCKKLFTHVIMT